MVLPSLHLILLYIGFKVEDLALLHIESEKVQFLINLF